MTDQDKSEKQAAIVLTGARKKRGAGTKPRLVMVFAAFFAVYAVIGARLATLAIGGEDRSAGRYEKTLVSRPDIVDRNGRVLATDIDTASLFAEPRTIGDPDEALEKLLTVLPDLDRETTYRRLSSNAGFVWLRRELTPRQQHAIHELGIPGIKFEREKLRFYPGGPTAAHILGLVNIDNEGIAGIERYIDRSGLAELRQAGLATEEALAPVPLSIDLRLQHAVRAELAGAMERYSAIGAAATVLDAHTGEILALASLPDYDPNNPVDQQKKDRLNRMTAGIYEMGSTFKAFTLAMALDSGMATMDTVVDASSKIRVGRFSIGDFHGKYRPLTVPEVFIYSSNIGTAKLADALGVDHHRAFLTKLHLLDKMDLELPEVRVPSQPSEWKRLNSLTIAFGHGVATTPLQTAAAAAALVNGGRYIPPTLMPRTLEQANELGEQVISEQTSANMRHLMRLNVERGSGKQAEVIGYEVGGKTGTAEKIVDGRYAKDKRYNAFLSAFPMADPRYVVLVTIDEPKAPEGGGGVTAGSNAAPTVGAIISRVAPILGISPDFGQEAGALLASH